MGESSAKGCRSCRLLGWRFAVWILPGLGTLAGCGAAGMAPVSGLVTVDNQPVAGASVVFAPEAGGRIATAVTNEDGRFELTTHRQCDGAAVGAHRVSITAVTDATPASPQSDGNEDAASVFEAAAGTSKIQWIVPQEYANAKTSNLRFEVKPGQDNHAAFNF